MDKENIPPPFVYSPLLERQNGLFHSFSTRRAVLDEDGTPLFKGSGVYLKQTHSADVLIVQKPPSEGLHIFGEGDGLLTKVRNLSLFIKTADCAPIALYDPIEGVIGAVHSGWRGTLGGILEEAIKKMTQFFLTKPENLLVVFGPSISYDAFEVGPELIEAFKEKYPFFKEGEHYSPSKASSGKYFLGLKEVLRSHATSLGILDRHIDLLNYCTYLQPDLFYSHRRAKESSRIWLRICLV